MNKSTEKLLVYEYRTKILKDTLNYRRDQLLYLKNLASRQYRSLLEQKYPLLKAMENELLGEALPSFLEMSFLKYNIRSTLLFHEFMISHVPIIGNNYKFVFDPYPITAFSQARVFQIYNYENSYSDIFDVRNIFAQNITPNYDKSLNVEGDRGDIYVDNNRLCLSIPLDVHVLLFDIKAEMEDRHWNWRKALPKDYVYRESSAVEVQDRKNTLLVLQGNIEKAISLCSAPVDKVFGDVFDSDDKESLHTYESLYFYMVHHPNKSAQKLEFFQDIDEDYNKAYVLIYSYDSENDENYWNKGRTKDLRKK